MTRCSLCGADDLGFTCPYCNTVYCSDHRLPESHGCPAMHKVREVAQRRVSDSLGGQDDENVIQTPRRVKKRRRSKRGRFSPTEIRHLAIASVLVVLVGISIFGNSLGIINAISVVQTFISLGLWWVIVGTVGIFLASFMAHELAHKFVAQSYGMWSEFRMTTMGYYLSAMAILFSLPIFGTGVVYTSGTTNVEHNGKSNLAGPLTNFVIAALLTIIAILLAVLKVPLFALGFLLRYGVQLNAFLGLFNMIPLQPFDGATVRYWSNRVWVALTVGLLFLLIFGYFAFPTIIAYSIAS
ncbi:MAG: AN1-type zinc finger domain-containing protein [Candidatus Thorarchaeota archaeon]